MDKHVSVKEYETLRLATNRIAVEMVWSEGMGDYEKSLKVVFFRLNAISIWKNLA